MNQVQLNGGQISDYNDDSEVSGRRLQDNLRRRFSLIVAYLQLRGSRFSFLRLTLSPIHLTHKYSLLLLPHAT